MASEVADWGELYSTEEYQSLETVDEKLTVLHGWAGLKYDSFDDSTSDGDVLKVDLGIKLMEQRIHNDGVPTSMEDDPTSVLRGLQVLEKGDLETLREVNTNLGKVMRGDATYNEEEGVYQLYGKERKATNLPHTVKQAHLDWLKTQQDTSSDRLNWITRRVRDTESSEDSLNGIEVNYAAAALGRAQFEALVDNEGGLSDAEKFRIKRKYRTYRFHASMDFNDYVTSKTLSERPFGARSIFEKDLEDGEELDVESFQMFFTKDRISNYKDEGWAGVDKDRVTDEILQLWAVKRGLGDYADYITNNKEESAQVRESLLGMYKDALVNHRETWKEGEAVRKESNGSFVINPNWLTLSDEDIRANVSASDIEVPEEVLEAFIKSADATREERAVEVLKFAPALAEGALGITWNAQAKDLMLFNGANSDKDWTPQEMVEEYIKNTKDPENFWQQVGYGVPTLDNIGSWLQTWSSEDGGWFGDAAYGVGNFLRGLQAGATQEMGLMGARAVGSVATAFGADGELLEGISETSRQIHALDSIHGKAPRWGRMFGQEIALLGLTAGVGKAGHVVRHRKLQKALVDVSNRKAIKKNLDEFASDITVGEVAASPLGAVGKYRQFTDKLAGKTYFGLQASRSGAAMYTDAFVKVKNELINDAGMDPDEAEDIARTNAILPGIGGALITYSMMKLVPGDVMGGIFNKGSGITVANMMKRLKMTRKTWKQAMASPEIKKEIIEILGSSFALKSLLRNRGVKAGVREAAEEFLDEIGQGVLTMATWNPAMTWSETVSHATEAAFVGAWLGGVAGHFAQRKPIIEDQIAPEFQVKLRDLEIKINDLRDSGNLETAEAIKDISDDIEETAPRVPLESVPDPDSAAPVELGTEGDYFHAPGEFLDNADNSGRGLKINLGGEDFIIPNIEELEVEPGKPTYPDLSGVKDADGVVELMGDEKYRPQPLGQNYRSFVEDNVGTLEQNNREAIVAKFMAKVAEIGTRSGTAEELTVDYKNLLTEAHRVMKGDPDLLGFFYARANDIVKDTFKGLFARGFYDQVIENVASYHNPGPVPYTGIILDESERGQRRAATFKNREWLHAYVKSMSAGYAGAKGLVTGADGAEVAEVFGVAMDLAFAVQDVLAERHKGDRALLVNLDKEAKKFFENFKSGFGVWETHGKDQSDMQYADKTGSPLRAIKIFYDKSRAHLSNSIPAAEMRTALKELSDEGGRSRKRLVSYATESADGLSLPLLYMPRASKGVLNDHRKSKQDKKILILNTEQTKDGITEILLHRRYRTRTQDENYSNVWDEGADVPFIPNESNVLRHIALLWDTHTQPTEEGGEPTDLSKDQFAKIVEEDELIEGLLVLDDDLVRAAGWRSLLLNTFWVQREVSKTSSEPSEGNVERPILDDMVRMDRVITVETFSNKTDERSRELSDSASNMFWDKIAEFPESGQLSFLEFVNRVKSHDNSLASNVKGAQARVEFLVELQLAWTEGVKAARAQIISKVDVDQQVEVAERLKNRIPSQPLNHNKAREILGWKEAGSAPAQVINDITDIFHISDPATPIPAKLSAISSNPVDSVDVGWTTKDTTGIHAQWAHDKSKGRWFASVDGKMIVAQDSTRVWGVWVSNELAGDERAYDQVKAKGEEEVKADGGEGGFFSSALKGKAAAEEHLALLLRSDVKTRTFALKNKNGVFDSDNLIHIEVGPTAKNEGWSEFSWGDHAAADSYKLKRTYGVKPYRFGHDLKLSSLSADQLKELGVLVNNFLQQNKDDSEKRFNAMADSMAIKHALNTVLQASLGSILIPHRISLKSPELLANKGRLPGTARKLAFKYLTIDSSRPALITDSVKNTLRGWTILEGNKFGFKLSQRTGQPMDMEREPVLEFAEALVGGVTENKERLEVFLNKFIDSQETPTMEQVLVKSPDTYAALMMGAYEMLFEEEGMMETVVVPQMLKLSPASKDFIGGVLEGVEERLLEHSSEDPRGTVLGPDKQITPGVTKRVREFYLKSSTQANKDIARVSLNRLVGNAVTEKALNLQNPEQAIIRISELLRMKDNRTGEEMLKAERDKGTQKINPIVEPKKKLRTYELRGASDVLQKTSLLQEAAETAIKTVQIQAALTRTAVNKLVEADVEAAGGITPADVTWHAGDIKGTWIAGSKAFDRQKSKLIDAFASDFLATFRSRKLTHSLHYVPGVGSLSKGDLISGKQKIQQLVRQVAENPDVALTSFIPGQSASAKELRGVLSEYREKFKSIDDLAGKGIQLHPTDEKVGRTRVYEMFRTDDAGNLTSFGLQRGTTFVGGATPAKYSQHQEDVQKLQEEIESHEADLSAKRLKRSRIVDKSKLTFKSPGVEKGELMTVSELQKKLKGVKKDTRGKREELVYRYEGGEDLDVEIAQVEGEVKILEGKIKKEKEDFASNLKPGLAGVKQQATAAATEEFKRLIKKTVIHSSTYVKAEKALQANIKSLHHALHAKKPGEEGQDWATAVGAIARDLKRRTHTISENLTVSQRGNHALANINMMYQYAVAGSVITPPGSKTSRADEGLTSAPTFKEVGYFKSTSETSLDKHVAKLKVRQETVPLTQFDASYKVTREEDGENISFSRVHLNKTVKDLKGVRERKLLPSTKGGFIKEATAAGLANRPPNRRLKEARDKDGEVSFTNFVSNADAEVANNPKAWHVLDSYFHVVDKNGELIFTNHPFHMASYFSDGTTTHEGVTTYPGPIKVPKGYGGPKGKKLHPGLVLSKDQQFIIGAATHFPASDLLPKGVLDRRANTASYVMASRPGPVGGLTEVELGITLADLQDRFTSAEKRAAGQHQMGKMTAESKEITEAIDVLNGVVLDPNDGATLTPHEIEFFRDGLAITRKINPDVPVFQTKKTGEVVVPTYEEIRKGRAGLDLSQTSLVTVLSNSYDRLMQKEDPTDDKSPVADGDIRREIGSKTDQGWRERFMVNAVLSMVRTRMALDSSPLRTQKTQGARTTTILERFAQKDTDRQKLWDEIKHPGKEIVGQVRYASGIQTSADIKIFPRGKFKDILLAIAQLEGMRTADRGGPLNHLLGNDSIVRLLQSADQYAGFAEEIDRKASAWKSPRELLIAVIKATTTDGAVVEDKQGKFEQTATGATPAEAAMAKEDKEAGEGETADPDAQEVFDTSRNNDSNDDGGMGPRVEGGDVDPDSADPWAPGHDSSTEGQAGNVLSIASAMFGPHTPFDGLTERTREELATRVLEELTTLDVVDGDADSLRRALFKIRDGALDGTYPAHYAELADILLKSGKIDFESLSLVVTDKIMEAGHYNPKTKTIAINSEATNPRGLHDLIIHELFHVAFDKVLSDPRAKNHKLVIQALDTLIDRGRAFYEMGDANRIGAQKRAEFQAQREADNYSLEIIKGLVEESSSVFKAELSSEPTPQDLREVYRNIRAEELGANKYFDDSIQLRHALGINEDGSYRDPDSTRSEFYVHLITDSTTQWYMKEIDRISPEGSLWDGSIRVITRGISDEDEYDFADELVGAFLTLSGNEKYRDLGATRTLQEIIGHTAQDLGNVSEFRASAPGFSPDFDLKNLTHNFSAKADKILSKLGPARDIISAFNVRVDTKMDPSSPEVSNVPGAINIPASSGIRERQLIATTVTSAYEAAYTPGERASTLKGFLASSPLAAQFLQNTVNSAGSWENLVGIIVADAFYGDQQTDFESQLQSLRAEVLSRSFGLNAARHVEELLEVLGRIVPEKRSFIKENYLSDDPANQWSKQGFVGDKIIGERAVEKHGLAIAPDDYVSAKEEAAASNLNFEDYINKYVDDAEARRELMVVEGEMLLQLEEYNQNPDPDERAVVGLQRVISGLPHDATTDDILASKASEAFKAGGKKAGEAVRELAEEISNKGKKFLKPKFVGKIWGTLKKLKNPLTVDLDPTTGLTEKPPALEHKQALEVPGIGPGNLGHHLRLDGFLRMLTVPGKGGKLLHEHYKVLRGDINRGATTTQLLTSALNKQLREQYGVNSLGELSETWDSAKWAETWGLPAETKAGAHLHRLINATLGEKNDEVLVNEFGPRTPPPTWGGPVWSALPVDAGLTLRERVLKWRDIQLQGNRARSAGRRKHIRDKWESGDEAEGLAQVEFMKKERAQRTEIDAEVRSAAAGALLLLYKDAAKNFKAFQDGAMRQIENLDDEHLASTGRKGEKKTTANSLSASLKAMRGAITKLQGVILGSKILEEQLSSAPASQGPYSLGAQLFAADSMFQSMQGKISASSDIYLTTTYQLNDEKKNYMRWLGSTEPEARRRYHLAYKHFKDKRLMDKAKKLAKQSDNLEVWDALRLLKLENEPIPHAEVADDVRRFVQSFGAKSVETSALGLMNVKTLMPKKDITTPLQGAAGAYQDNIFNAARTLTTLTTLNANHQFLTSIKEMLGRVEKEANEGRDPNDTNLVLLSDEAGHQQHGLVRFTAPEGSGGFASGNFGPLEGMYGPPLLVQALQEFGRKNYAGVQKHLMGLSSMTMANVTTRRPRTHVRNFVGNPIFLVNQGIPLHAIKGFRILTDWIHGGEGAGSAVMKAAMIGAKDQIEALPNSNKLSTALKNTLSFFIANDSSRFLGNTSVFEPEMMAIMEEYSEFLATGQDVRSNVIQEARKSVLEAGGGDPIFGLSMVPSSKVRGVAKYARSIDKVLEGMYGAEDDYWKATAYEAQLTKLANVFELSKIDSEEKFAPFALRKRVGQMINGKYEGAMTPEQALHILDTFKPRTEKQRADREKLLKSDRRSAALHTLKVEAAYRLHQTMPNYSMTVALVKWMKRNQVTAYVAPFISFYAEVLRLSVATPKLAAEEIMLGIKTKNLKLQGMGWNRGIWSMGTLWGGSQVLQGLWSLLGAMMGALTSGDEEDKDLTADVLGQNTNADGIDDVKALKRFLHEWYQKGTLAFFGDHDGGFPMMMDVSHMMPLAAPVDAVRRFKEAVMGQRETEGPFQEGAVDMFGQFFQPQMWAQALSGGRYQTKDSLSEFESKITDPAWAAGKELWSIAIPGYMTDFFKLIGAIKDSGKIVRGQKVSIPDTIASAVLGINFKRIDIRDEFERKMSLRGKQLKDAKSELNWLLRGKSTVSKAEIEEKVEEYRELSRKITLRTIRDYKAAKHYIKHDADAIMGNKLGKDLLGQVYGEYHSLAPVSGTTVSTAYRVASEINNPERIEGMNAMYSQPTEFFEAGEIMAPLNR